MRLAVGPFASSCKLALPTPMAKQHPTWNAGALNHIMHAAVHACAAAAIAPVPQPPGLHCRAAPAAFRTPHPSGHPWAWLNSSARVACCQRVWLPPPKPIPARRSPWAVTPFLVHLRALIQAIKDTSGTLRTGTSLPPACSHVLPSPDRRPGHPAALQRRPGPPPAAGACAAAAARPAAPPCGTCLFPPAHSTTPIPQANDTSGEPVRTGTKSSLETNTL